MSAAIASLPMYDLPFLRPKVDAWWSALADALRAQGFEDVPATLERTSVREEHWRSPSLLLSQTCGYPLLTAFGADLQLVATPVYNAPGCEGPTYRSFVIVRADNAATSLADLKGATCVINGWDSQSGMNVLRHSLAPLASGDTFFRDVKVSGTHHGSIAMIAAGDADVASVDCVSHALMAAHAPELLAGTRVLCQTDAAPALPYVTTAAASKDTVHRLRAALDLVVRDPALAALRNDLLIDGFDIVALNAYDVMLEMEQGAIAAGYPRLA